MWCFTCKYSSEIVLPPDNLKTDFLCFSLLIFCAWERRNESSFEFISLWVSKESPLINNYVIRRYIVGSKLYPKSVINIARNEYVVFIIWNGNKISYNWPNKSCTSNLHIGDQVQWCHPSNGQFFGVLCSMQHERYHLLLWLVQPMPSDFVKVVNHLIVLSEGRNRWLRT